MPRRSSWGGSAMTSRPSMVIAPLVGLDHAVDHPQRRGLAAARRADQHGDLAGRHLDRQLVDGVGAVGEPLGHVVEADHDPVAPFPVIPPRYPAVPAGQRPPAGGTGRRLAGSTAMTKQVADATSDPPSDRRSGAARTRAGRRRPHQREQPPDLYTWPCGHRRSPQRVRDGRADVADLAADPHRSVAAVVRRRGRGRLHRAQRHDAGHGRRRRPARRPLRARAGRRRARVLVLHQHRRRRRAAS